MSASTTPELRAARLDGGPGPRNLFHAGAIDAVGIVVTAFAVGLGHLAVRRARLGSTELFTG